MRRGSKREKFSFKPSRDLEFGFSRVVIFAGKDHVPLTFGSFWHSFTSFSNVSLAQKESRNDPGFRSSSFDFTWRLPWMQKWLTLYTDSIVHDDVSPVAAPRRAAVNPGLYLSHLPKLPHVDLRAEAVSTDPVGHRDREDNSSITNSNILTAIPSRIICLEVGSGGKVKGARLGSPTGSAPKSTFNWAIATRRSPRPSFPRDNAE